MKDTQKAKNYLLQIQKTEKMIQRLTSTVATLRSSLTSQSYELKPDKVQTSGPKNVLEETVSKIDELERLINTRIDELVDRKQRAYLEISRVPNLDQQNVLIGRYIEGRKWEQVSSEINFSISQVYKIHGAALLAFVKENPETISEKEA